MNLLVIWSILSRELSKEDMELKLEIQGNFLLWSAAREGRISFRDLIGAIRIRVPYCTMAKLTRFCPKNIFPSLLQDWFNKQMRAKQITTRTAKKIIIQWLAVMICRLSNRAQPVWAYEFPDRTGTGIQICWTGPSGPDLIWTYIFKHFTYKVWGLSIFIK